MATATTGVPTAPNPNNFTRADVRELHYIASLANVDSILTNGIWSHNKVRHIRVEDVSNNSVQDLRAVKDVPRAVQGRRALTVHDHAVLYFNAHNAMTYVIVQKKERGSICILRLAKEILNYRHTVVSNQNAATNAATFQAAGNFSLSPRRKTAILDPSSLATTQDQVAREAYRQRRQAEVLVPYLIPKECIYTATNRFRHEFAVN